MHYSLSKYDFTLVTDKSKIDVDYVHGFLSQSYWSPGISIEKVRKGIQGSLCFSLLCKDQQVGFARVITDQATFGYLCDVFIDEKFRKKGLGKWMIESIVHHPGLGDLRKFLLATRDAHSLYEHCGFTTITNPERYMVYNPHKL